MAKKRSEQKVNKQGGLILLLTNVVHSVGIPGALIVLMIWLILTCATIEQKQDIIDKWILFKNNDQCQVFAISVIIFAFLIYILEMYAFYRIRKLDLGEIKRLSELRNNDQKSALDKPLHTSE